MMNISLQCICPDDLPDVARLANNREIASMTANLPHPYTDKHAHKWFNYLEKHENEHVFSVRNNGRFTGVVGLVHEPDHNRAELGYWLGQNDWKKGIMSVAVGMAAAYAFEVLNVDRIYARCFAGNTASRRVLEKNGFVSEGCQRRHYIRMGTVHDVINFGLLKEEFRLQ